MAMKNIESEMTEDNDYLDDAKWLQRMYERYNRIGNIKELHELLMAVPDAYDVFVGGIIRYATTSRARKERVVDFLKEHPEARSSEVIEFVIRQPDFHDAAMQTELERKLTDVPDVYESFTTAVLNYVIGKIGRTEKVLEYVNGNPGAMTSDILEFISNQDDFYEQ